MSRTDPISDDVRAEVLRLQGEGVGCNEIARALRIGASSVSRIVRAAGLSFDRVATEIATRARTIDLANMRTTLLQKMAVASSDMLDDIDGPYLVYNFGGRDNEYREHLLDAAPVEVRRSVITTAGLTVDRVSRYLDTRPAEGLEEVKGLLGRLEEMLDAEFSEADDAEFDAEAASAL